MTVYGFVGASGTGKSHRALELARGLSVSYIIDDGLLIKENLVLAGSSAKREPSKLASVRRALFMEREHQEMVRGAISASGLDSIIILGTSSNMVDEIAKRLLLPPVSRYINISDVASPEEIDAARRVRTTEGKHVIPVPTFALKKEFSGYFLAPLKRLARFGIEVAAGSSASPKNDEGVLDRKGREVPRSPAYMGERTIVRPTFSYLGGYSISKTALAQLITCIVQKTEGIVKAVDVFADLTENGLAAEISVTVKYGYKINIVLRNAQRMLRYEIDRQTALNVQRVDVTAKSLVVARGRAKASNIE